MYIEEAWYYGNMQDNIQQPVPSNTLPTPVVPTVTEPIVQQQTAQPDTSVQTVNNEGVQQNNPPIANPLATPAPLSEAAAPHAEHEPLPSIGKSEWNSLSEVSPQISQEVKDAGVEVVHPNPQVSVQAQAVGVTPAKEETPMMVDEDFMRSPISLVKAEEILRTDKNGDDSLRWFATLVVREMAIAHMKQMSKQK